MKNVFIRHAVYGIVLLNLALIPVFGLLIYRFFPPSNDLTGLSLVAPKVTLLSVVIALAMFQYNYFYNESRETERRLETGDYGPLWTDYIRTADESRAMLNTPDAVTRFTPQVLDKMRTNLNQMDAAIGRARQEWIHSLHLGLAEMAVRFGIILSVAFLLLSSVTLDFVFQVWGLKILSPEFYSVVAFLMSIILALIYLVFMVIVVQGHIRLYYKEN